MGVAKVIFRIAKWISRMRRRKKSISCRRPRRLKSERRGPACPGNPRPGMGPFKLVPCPGMGVAKVIFRIAKWISRMRRRKKINLLQEASMSEEAGGDLQEES